MTVFALKRAALLIQQVAGGTVSSEIFDNYPEPVAPFDVEVTYKNIHRLLARRLRTRRFAGIITALDIQIVTGTEEGLSLKVPPYRVDVTRDVDVIEEILRIYGYNNIEIPTQIRASLNNASRPEKDTVQNAISDWLSANGFNEILNNSLTKSSYYDNLNTAVKILNPLSSDLDVMRQTMLYSGLEAIAHNSNRKAGDLKFYEFGKTYHLVEDKYREDQHFALFLTGNNTAEQWNQKQNAVSFYNLKAVIDTLLERLSIKDFTIEDTTCSKLAYGLNYSRGPKRLVKFGAVNAKALKKADVDQPVFYAEFNFDLVLQMVRKNVVVNQEIPKFPSVRRDLSMLIDKAVTFNQLKQIAQKTDKKLLKEVNVFDVYEGDKLPAGKKSYALSFIIQDDEKTLADKAIESLVQKLIYNLGKEVGAEVRR
jgi:phenylalanyl-tRNA synthetase beta chain